MKRCLGRDASGKDFTALKWLQKEEEMLTEMKSNSKANCLVRWVASMWDDHSIVALQTYLARRVLGDHLTYCPT